MEYWSYILSSGNRQVAISVVHEKRRQINNVSWSPWKQYSFICFGIYRFEIISKKPSGVISGWQRIANGPIEYSQHLPPDTRISL